MVRLFAAIELPDSIRWALEEATASLRSKWKLPEVRWTQPASLHLTLRFYGDVRDERVDELIQAVAAVAERHARFELDVATIRGFPTSSRPRVLAAELEPSESLQRLAAALESGAQRFGFSPEPRRFRPHITLARVRAPVSARGRVAFGLQSFGCATARPAWWVEGVRLYRSELRPSGARYRSMGWGALAAA